MNLREQPDGSLVLTYDSSLWTKWLIGATVLMLGTAVYDYFIGARGDDRLIGLLGGAATTGLIALVFLEQCRFRVDPVSRLVEWDQRWGFRRRTGVVAFSQIQHVSVEVPIGDRGIPSRRVVMHLANGTLLPITVGYKPDVDGAIERAADTLRVALGQRAPSTEDSVRLLVQRGRQVDAVKLLIEKEHLTLTEAKQRVDNLRA
jgi:hypothetical protein